MDKINWINGQAGNTPLSAENLNLMQDNIENAIDDVDTNLNAKITGTTLYESTTGARSITLNDSAANYDYLEIYDSLFICHKIAEPNGRSIDLSYIIAYTTEHKLRNFCSKCSISGTSITLSNGYFYDNDGYYQANNGFVIKKVIGYKY